MSQHRRSPAPPSARRRKRGPGRRTPVLVGAGALLLAGAGTAAFLGTQGDGDDDPTRVVASGAEHRTDPRATEQRDRVAAIEAAEQADRDREKAELERAQAQELRAKRAEAARAAQSERRARAEARKEAAAKKRAAEKKAEEKKRKAAPEGVTAQESRMVALLNERRAGMGLSRVEESGELAAEAEKCSAASLEKNALEHCGHEVLFMGGENTTPEAMLEAWFNSPGHKTALTYDSSTKAGAAVVTNGSGQLVAAINIDY